LVAWGSASPLLFGFDETSVSLLLMIGLLLLVEAIRAFALPEPLLTGQKLGCISHWPNDKCIAPSLLICWLNWYDQKPFIGLIGAGQMNDVGAVPTAAGETLEIFWMRSYHHNVGSHVKLPAGRARNPLPHIHVGDAKPVDVLRSSGNTVRHPLKENTIETSRVVMLGTGWRTRQAGPIIRALTENSKFATLAGRIIHDRCAVGYELWCGPQSVRNFFKVGYGQVFSGGLGARCQRSEKTKYN
jgi:hypothetical protein